MPGFKKSMVKSGGNGMFLDISTPDRLPDMLRADQFAFVSLPLSEIIDGGVNPENIGTSPWKMSGLLLLSQDQVGEMQESLHPSSETK